MPRLRDCVIRRRGFGGGAGDPARPSLPKCETLIPGAFQSVGSAHVGERVPSAPYNRRSRRIIFRSCRTSSALRSRSRRSPSGRDSGIACPGCGGTPLRALPGATVPRRRFAVIERCRPPSAPAAHRRPDPSLPCARRRSGCRRFLHFCKGDYGRSAPEAIRAAAPNRPGRKPTTPAFAPRVVGSRIHVLPAPGPIAWRWDHAMRRIAGRAASPSGAGTAARSSESWPRSSLPRPGFWAFFAIAAIATSK